VIVICNAGCHYLLSKYLTMVKGNTNTIDAYFKRRRTDQELVNEDPATHPPPLFQLEQQNQEELEVQRNNEQVLFRGIEFLERDPAKRPQIWQYPPNQRDVVKRAYLNLGPMQPLLQTYKPSGPQHHRRRFQYHWFNCFPSWLEYSDSNHRAYCLFCFVSNKSILMSSPFKVLDPGRRLEMGNNVHF